MLNIKNFGWTFWVKYVILQMLKRAERKLRVMKKIWSIDGKDFTKREEAKKFLAKAWKKDPVEYLDGFDMICGFEEYLADSNKIDLHTWLLQLSACDNKTQLDKKMKELRHFISIFIDEIVDEDVDEWLVEEV